MGEAGTTGKHIGPRKPRRLELEAVVLGITEREVASRRVKAKLPTSEEALLRQQRVNVDEIFAGA